MKHGTVRLKNAVFYAHHGVMAEEHRVGGRYEVDITMDLDFSDAAVSDDLQRTVDYEKVYARVKKVITQNNFYLIERLSYLIAIGILENDPMLSSVEVAVRKANPPVGGPCDFAEATFRAVRHEGI